MPIPLKFGVVGIDHRHAYGQVQNLVNAGAELAGWWTQGTPQTLTGFVKRFPDAKRCKSRTELLDDPAIELIVTAARPCDRANLAIEAIARGKHVMTDKPGCTSLVQLEALKTAVEQYNRIWSVNFSERFESPATTRADELVTSGAIGEIVNTIATGPHRLNKQTRPEWFFNLQEYGGILCDLASHQIDQFLHFTGSDDAAIEFARVANYTNPDTPGLQDFGEIMLRSNKASGYIRVDWYTPDALPTWGDGRTFLQGTKGTIEMRKYCELGQSERTDNLYLVNDDTCQYIDARKAGMPYFSRLIADIRQGTQTAMLQTHAFKVMELALKAQQIADKSYNGPE